MAARQGIRLESLRDLPVVHLAVGALACLFVLSPALFTPRGFGPDYTNHLWLVWQQGLAISDTGHPTLFLQQPGGIFQPFYGFYGGTLYALVGGASALLGNHAYEVYVASIGAAVALAYGGVWWIGRQLGVGRWAAHLPAFILVTGAYYLTDAYARGAWPELVALSAVPMFLAGAARLLSGPWRAGPVALFVVATVLMTGSHNITLLWSVLVIGPIAIAAWAAAGSNRPSPRRLAMTIGLAALSVGINAWFLVLDVLHSGDVRAWEQSQHFINHGFRRGFYFDNLGVILDPLRGVPSQSTTYGLAIAAPVAAFGFSLVLFALAWPRLDRAGRGIRALWLILLAASAVIVGLIVMPADWWIALGRPFANIQFPYRLAGWLLLVVAVQMAVSLRLARGLGGWRRDVAAILALALVAATVVQAAAQMYSGPRLDGKVNSAVHPRQDAFANGPTAPPWTFYDPFSYADASRPKVRTPESRTILMPVPPPGATSLTAELTLPPGRAPVATNIAAGPYVARIEGMRVLGRTHGGAAVVEPPRGASGTARLTVVADGGSAQTAAAVVSLLCLLGVVSLLIALTIGRRLRYRRAPV